MFPRAREMGCPTPCRAPSDPTAELESIDAREHEVEDDQVDLSLLDHAACSASVCRFECVVTRTREIADDDLAHDRLVVDDEDSSHGSILRSIGLRRGEQAVRRLVVS